MNKEVTSQKSSLGLSSIIPWLIGLLIVSLDQGTKYIIETKVRLYTKISVIPGFFDIVHIKNRGVAFGIMSDNKSVWPLVIFPAINILAFAVLVYLYRTTPATDKITRGSFLLIATGAVGNFIDRIRNDGGVTDFLLFYINQYQWPAFNVADSCITVGVALLAWRMIIHPAPLDKVPAE